MSSRKEIAAILTYATYNRFLNRGATFPQVEFGRGKIDLLNLAKFEDNGITLDFSISGYEIKSCRQDFLSDDKWLKYTTFEVLDKLEFICPDGAITAEDLSPANVLDRLSEPRRFWLKTAGYETDDQIARVVERVGLKTYTYEQLEKIAERLRGIDYHPSWVPCPKVIKRTRSIKKCRPKIPPLEFAGNSYPRKTEKIVIVRQLLYKSSREFANRFRIKAGGS